jgi:ATP-binding cassette subfamily B (MDR/TAP) protein 1
MPSHSPPATEPDILNGEPEKQSSSNLTDEEKKIIETQTQGPDRKISLFSLLRYANRTETCIMLVALLASIVSGAVLPLMTLVYGNFAQSFTSFAVDDDAKHRFQDQINTLTLYFVYLGIASLVTVYVATVGFAYTGEKITQRIREEYLRAIFRQNIAFFDFLGAGEVTTRITSGMTASYWHVEIC